MCSPPFLSKQLRLAIAGTILLLAASLKPLDSRSQTTELIVDSSGVLASFPISYPFGPEATKIRLNVDQLTGSYLHSLNDTLSAKAQRMTDFLQEENTQAFYKWLFGEELYNSSDENSFYGQLLRWKTYLKAPSTPPAKPFTYFPMLPSNDVIRDSLFWIYSHDNKLHKRLVEANPLDISGQSYWIVPGFHNEVSFKLVMKDLWQQFLIAAYNRSVPSDITKLKTKTLDDTWKKDLDKLLVRARFAISELKDSSKHYGDPSCFRDMLSQFENALGQTPMVKFLQNNQNFFLTWLWFNDGKPTIDPFPFTTSKEFPIPLSSADSMNRIRARVFDSLYSELRNLDTANLIKIYKDTLTIRDIARQQNRGRDIFKLDDSLARDQHNKDSLKLFQSTLRNIYNFHFPYQSREDSTIAIHQFDASKAFRHVDEMDPILKRPHHLRKLLSRIPDNEMALITVHNTPSYMKVTLTESTTAIKDQSSVQQLLSDTAFSSIGTLASLFTAASFSNLFSFTASPIKPAPAVIIPPAVPDVLIPADPSNTQFQAFFRHAGQFTAYMATRSALLGETQAAQQRERANALYSFVVHIDGRSDTVITDDDNQIVNCEGTVEKLLDTVYLNIVKTAPNVLCYETFVDDQAKKHSKNFCDSAGSSGKLQEFLQKVGPLFKNLLDARITEMDNLRVTMVDDIAKDTGIIIGSLQHFGHFMVPPDKLTADDTNLPDSSLYLSRILYLNQASTLKQDNYYLTSINIRSKDTAKVAGGFFSKAPRHVIALGVGAEVTFNKLPLNTVTSTNGQLSISQDAQNVRLIVGLHIYPGKLFNLDDRFLVHRPYELGHGPFGVSTWSRLSIFLGTGIPDPLHNWYTGLGADLWPGLKLQTGAHWLWYTKYNILNNQIADQASAVRFAGWYIGLTIDPAGLITTLVSQFK